LTPRLLTFTHASSIILCIQSRPSLCGNSHPTFTSGHTLIPLPPAYAETLSAELEHFNIRVTIAVPGGFATKINAPARSGTPLAGYETFRDNLDKLVKNYAKIPRGDPDLGMSALVDAVRCEGRAAGHGPPPIWLFLGEDSMRDVRLRMQAFQSALEEWKDVGSNLGLPLEKLPA
jgi:hypothetical protein